MSSLVSNPSFCFIAPIEYLHYTNLSTTHLTLAHLVDQSDQYASFYQTRGDEGDFIMMDNSAYELKEPYSPEKLFDLASKSGATAIVLPDYPFQPAKRTIQAAEKYIPIFKKAGFKTFFVPQSEKGDLSDFLQAYKWAAQNPDVDIIGMSILGIPNALPAIDPSYARVVLTQMLIDRGIFAYEKHHHYLGLNSGPALEIPSLIRMKALDTIDSSGPIWSALMGHRYTHEADSYQMVKKLKNPVNFFIERSKDVSTHSRIAHNVQMTTDLFDPKVYAKGAVWYAEE